LRPPQDAGAVVVDAGTAGKGKLATTARTMRASRISFHGSSWRVLPS
jgi:hypothetical protein